MQTLWRAPRHTALVTTIAALMVAGCVTRPPGTEKQAEPDPRIEQAREAADAGRSTEAIELFEAAARDADGAAADRLWLRAGLLHARQDADTKARQALVRVPPKPSDATVEALRRLLAATLRSPDEAELAVTTLADGPPEALPDDLREYWLASHARALAEAGRPLEAARQRVERQRLLTAGPLASANREALWQHLMSVSLSELRNTVPAQPPDTFGGWLELGHAIRTNRLDPSRMRDAIESWYERYPDHPARQTAYAEVVAERAIQQANPPRHVALLLPLSGRFAEIGRAVQNGLITAYYERVPEQRPEIVVYDVGDNGRSPDAAYEDAVERGVDLVIGPLTKPAVEMITRRSEYPVPVLALNRVKPSDTPSGLYQFGLAPEDDAREAARLMQGMGWHNAVALAPDTDWGMRVLDAFAATYTEADGKGRLLETARYRSEGDDFSGPIKAVLNLDASEARYQRVRRTLGRSLKFEPRRRRDVEAIFMPAFSENARLLKPQIRFHRGIGLPTVATSHAYGGVPDPDRDDDLDGLVIVDTPWTLGAALPPDLRGLHTIATKTWPSQARRHPRLMALGADGFRLAGPVDVLASEPSLSLPGLTGELSVSGDGVIHRELGAGRFRQGVVTPLLVGPDTDNESRSARNADSETNSAP